MGSRTQIVKQAKGMVEHEKVSIRNVRKDGNDQIKKLEKDKEIGEDESKKAHTIFAPGGDRQRAVVKMGIITISRIATQIIAVFSLDRDLDPQFEFFNDVRFFPDKIYVCINKVDLIEGDREKKIEEMKKQIQDFFETRKIAISEFFITCGETVDDFDDVEKYNNRVAEMILEITIKN